MLLPALDGTTAPDGRTSHRRPHQDVWAYAEFDWNYRAND
jgi:hypothetical protein